MANAHDPSQPPGLPEMHDEAANTPMWVPGLGLGILLMGALWALVSAQMVEAPENNEVPIVEAAPAEAAPAE